MVGVLALAICLTAAPSAIANPYDLCGEGNCAYFCWDMMEKSWPVMFQIDRYWDAKDWANLIGEEKTVEDTVYKAVLVEEPSIGDFVIWPGQRGNPRGHVGFVVGIYKELPAFDYELPYVLSNELLQKPYIEYQVAESSNYADGLFPEKYNGCRYCISTYSKDDLENCLFLSWVIIA